MQYFHQQAKLVNKNWVFCLITEEKTEDPGEFPKATPSVLAQRPLITPGKNRSWGIS